MCSGALAFTNFLLSPNLSFDLTRDFNTQTCLLYNCRIWYIIGWILMVLSAYKHTAFYLAITIQGLVMFSLHFIKVCFTHKMVMSFVKTDTLSGKN